MIQKPVLTASTGLGRVCLVYLIKVNNSVRGRVGNLEFNFSLQIQIPLHKLQVLRSQGKVLDDEVVSYPFRLG